MFLSNKTAFAEENFKILKISVDNANSYISLDGNIDSSSITINQGKLVNPDRIFVDLNNAVLIGEKRDINLLNSIFSNIKVAQFSSSPNIVRLVITAKTADNLNFLNIIKYHNSIILKLKPIGLRPELSEIDFQKNDKAVSAKTANIKANNTNINTPDKNIDPNLKTNTNQASVPLKELKLEKHPMYYKALPAKPPLTQATTANDQNKTVYTINNIQVKDGNILITGNGSISIKEPFSLKDPSRIVFDFPCSSIANREMLKDYTLDTADTFKAGQFDKDTIRVVVKTETPEKYRSVLSQDLRSIVISKLPRIDFSIFPTTESPVNITKIQVRTIDDLTTVVIIENDGPILHNIKRTSDKIIFEMPNVKPPDKKMIYDLPKTMQFKGIEVIQPSNNASGVNIAFPLKNITKVESRLSIDGRVLELLLKDNLLPIVNVKTGSSRKIILDPGHGGVDCGAINGKILEKDINIDIAQRIKKYLAMSGVNVEMTRYDDKYLSLKERSDFANAKMPDAFVSLHVNSCERPDIKGIETHWYTPESRELAKTIHNNITSAIASPDRGIFKSMFYVIHHTKVPSVLVEIGFMSNSQELKNLITEKRKEETARSITNGILLYLNSTYDTNK
jgi:N-acetylmuramoyl-L-alanine amidase